MFLDSWKKFRALRDKKNKYSNSRVDRKKNFWTKKTPIVLPVQVKWSVSNAMVFIRLLSDSYMSHLISWPCPPLAIYIYIYIYTWVTLIISVYFSNNLHLLSSTTLRHNRLITLPITQPDNDDRRLINDTSPLKNEWHNIHSITKLFRMLLFKYKKYG
jgi:hypothetical protein